MLTSKIIYGIKNEQESLTESFDKILSSNSSYIFMGSYSFNLPYRL